LQQVRGLVVSKSQGDEATNALPLDMMRISDNGGLCNGGMGDESGLDLGGADAMTGYVEDIVDAAGDPDVIVLISSGAVSREVVAGIRGHVDVEVAVVVSETGAGHAGPGLFDGEDSFGYGGGDFVSSLGVEYDRVDAVEGEGAAAGLHGGDVRQVGDDVASGLGLPVGVNNSSFLVANGVVVPAPGLWVDGLTDGAEDPEGGEVVFGGNVVSEAHE